MIILGHKYKFNELELRKINSMNIKPIYISDLSDIKNIKTKINEINPSYIILNSGEKLSNELISYLTNLELQGVKFFTMEHFLEHFFGKLYIPEKIEQLDFLYEIKPYSKTQFIFKKTIDLFLTFFLGIITLPIMLYSVYRIKKESPDGPVIFKQIRIGKNKKPFICYKFRSMRTDIDFFDPYTQENDPRIFPWGEVMRKTRIDELPQLWNVLKGDLHIIGPRAEWDELVKKYEKVWPFYHIRHINAPGITGWAQVNYPYGKNLEDTYQKLMYDLYYIKNWSVWLELKTIFKTVAVMLGKKGL